MAFTEVKNGSAVYMASSAITAVHGFTTRFGGVSEGIYSSLDLAENRGDDESRVRENYDIICTALGVERKKLVFSRQVHEDTVRCVSECDVHELFTPVPYEADALITDLPDLPLIIFTADCTPILLCDDVRGVIGAVHAGWRGTAMDIAGKAVREMQRVFGCDPADISAAIGPCISQCCFETGQEVPEAMRAVLGKDAEEFILPRGEKAMVDLKGLNRCMLERAGVKNIDVSEECTYCRSDKYWSHRKTRGERGSQAAIIAMRGQRI